MPINTPDLNVCQLTGGKCVSSRKRCIHFFRTSLHQRIPGPGSEQVLSRKIPYSLLYVARSLDVARCAR